MMMMMMMMMMMVMTNDGDDDGDDVFAFDHLAYDWVATGFAGIQHKRDSIQNIERLCCLMFFKTSNMYLFVFTSNMYQLLF